jgi:hypothetical protein
MLAYGVSVAALRAPVLGFGDGDGIGEGDGVGHGGGIGQPSSLYG